jgi:hypothetical protein
MNTAAQIDKLKKKVRQMLVSKTLGKSQLD